MAAGEWSWRSIGAAIVIPFNERHITEGKIGQERVGINLDSLLELIDGQKGLLVVEHVDSLAGQLLGLADDFPPVVAAYPDAVDFSASSEARSFPAVEFLPGGGDIIAVGVFVDELLPAGNRGGGGVSFIGMVAGLAIGLGRVIGRGRGNRANAELNRRCRIAHPPWRRFCCCHPIILPNNRREVSMMVPSRNGSIIESQRCRECRGDGEQDQREETTDNGLESHRTTRSLYRRQVISH